MLVALAKALLPNEVTEYILPPMLTVDGIVTVVALLGLLLHTTSHSAGCILVMVYFNE